MRFLLLAAMFWQTPQQPTATPDDSAVIAAGLQVYRRNCGVCHGVNGQGYRGPDLTIGNWSRSRTDAGLAQLIRLGIPSSGMPGTVLPEAEVTRLIAYLRTLTGPARVTTGNALNGQRVFSGKAACSGCHMVAGAGGRLGPDLTFVGATRSRAFIMRELTQPNDYMRRGYDTVTVVSSAGERIRGTLKNEDMFSIQMMTTTGELRSYLRKELSEVVRETESLMPAFGAGRLTAAETADLLRYLASLGTAPVAK